MNGWLVAISSIIRQNRDGRARSGSSVKRSSGRRRAEEAAADETDQQVFFVGQYK